MFSFFKKNQKKEQVQKIGKENNNIFVDDYNAFSECYKFMKLNEFINSYNMNDTMIGYISSTNKKYDLLLQKVQIKIIDGKIGIIPLNEQKKGIKITPNIISINNNRIIFETNNSIYTVEKIKEISEQVCMFV